jgi:hypothetical protein
LIVYILVLAASIMVRKKRTGPGSPERVLGSLRELLGRDPHSELTGDLNSMVEGVVSHLNRVAAVVRNTRAAVDITRAMEGQLHTIQVVAHLNINSVTFRGVDMQVVVHLNINRVTIRVRDVVVHAPEGVVCRSHTMAGIREGVVESVFHQVRQEQFPSCTKPRMSNIKPRWFHHLHRLLAHPLSLWLR